MAELRMSSATAAWLEANGGDDWGRPQFNRSSQFVSCDDLGGSARPSTSSGAPTSSEPSPRGASNALARQPSSTDAVRAVRSRLNSIGEHRRTLLSGTSLAELPEADDVRAALVSAQASARSSREAMSSSAAVPPSVPMPTPPRVIPSKPRHMSRQSTSGTSASGNLALVERSRGLGCGRGQRRGRQLWCQLSTEPREDGSPSLLLKLCRKQGGKVLRELVVSSVSDTEPSSVKHSFSVVGEAASAGRRGARKGASAHDELRLAASSPEEAALWVAALTEGLAGPAPKRPTRPGRSTSAAYALQTIKADLRRTARCLLPRGL